MKNRLSLSLLSLATIIFLGCGNDDVSSDQTTNDSAEVIKLQPQSGTKNYLFYGNTNHKSLGALKNIRVIDSNNPTKVLLSNDDTTDIGRASINKTLKYDANTNSYSDLSIDSISYISGKKPYKVSTKTGSTPVEIANSQESNISGTGIGGSFRYTEIEYLGTKQYMVAKKSDTNQILITTDMKATDASLPFNNKTLLSLTYPSYGAKEDGYIVYDSNVSDKKEIQKCTKEMVCTTIKEVTSEYKFVGDIGGTTDCIIDIDGDFYKLNKATAVITKLDIKTPTLLSGKVMTKANRSVASKYYFNANSIYFIDANQNISRYNTTTGEHKYISNDGKTDRIRAFTNDMVIYGPTDSEMYAVKKDGSSTEALTLSVATKTGGQKYTYDMAVGDQYIYNLFSLDKDSGKMTFKACLLKDEKVECKNNSTWAVVVLAQDGKLNFNSSIIYSPYAFIRVDDTDNYGGGTLKAIDPKNPMKDGITMGKTENFNFQTFTTRRDVLSSGDGGVILYAKNDLTYQGNAYYMNLNRENSLVNLTNEKSPDISEINGDSGHCHGRYCSVCHSFAGGKIYQDKAGKKSAKGYNIRFEFENGETLKAMVRKGEGENFNTPLQNLVGKNFTAVVYSESNGTVMNRSNEYSHRGAEYFNCNFCHGGNGALRHDAPSVITIEN